MAQTEQRTFYFDIPEAAAPLTNYIDLASCMTAANRVQYHQMHDSGNPNCFLITVRAIKGEHVFSHATNSFITGNAVKQTCAGWKAQMRHAGIKLKDLPPYGKHCRIALETGALSENTLGIVGESMWEISAQLEPLTAPAGSTMFTTYAATDKNTIRYQHFAGAGQISANQVTQVTVTDGAGAESNQPLVLLGTGAAEFNVIREYLRARRQTPDVSIDTPGPDEDSAMLNLFSVAEEMSDDIIDAIDDYMDYKPYTPDHKTNSYDELIQGADVNATTSATSQYPPAADTVEVPLGLLKVVSGANLTGFSITVEAIYEM